jgi:hypothetical protein
LPWGTCHEQRDANPSIAGTGVESDGKVAEGLRIFQDLKKDQASIIDNRSERFQFT